MEQFGWLVGLIGCISAAVVGQAELFGEPWRHYVTLAGIVGTAATGFMLQHPPPKWNGKERRHRDGV